jgi:hypothetical protein
MLYEFIDPYTIAAGAVALAQKAKDKLFGKNEKTTSSSSSTKKDNNTNDKSDIKSNTKNDSKSTPFKIFENSLLSQQINADKVLKYIYLKAAYENDNFSLKSSIQEIFETFTSTINSIEKKLHTTVNNVFNGASFLKTDSAFKLYIDKIISDGTRSWIKTEIDEIKNEKDILDFLNK